MGINQVTPFVKPSRKDQLDGDTLESKTIDARVELKERASQSASVIATIPIAGARAAMQQPEYSPAEMGRAKNTNDSAVTKADAEEAVRTLLSYFGEDPSREGLLDTPRRYVDAFEECLQGYKEDPIEILGRTFEDVAGYHDIVLMKNISVESHCEHHLFPITGMAHVAYLPSERVVGISKLARVVDVFSKRLVSQETLTEQIADAIDSALKPKGVAVLIDAQHSCITTRGIRKADVSCVTQRMTGVFDSDPAIETRFLRLIGQPG
ncbi:MAG: GTP cyclohydrolase I FolE [Pseudomonadota bacterium]